MIEAHLQALLDTVADAPEVATSDVALDKRGPQAGLIRGDITFVDGALLHFRELVDLESSPSRLMYSYHYQRADASLVFRYDDTPHHPELPTFPTTNTIRMNSTPSPPNRPPSQLCWMKSGDCVQIKSEPAGSAHSPMAQS